MEKNNVTSFVPKDKKNGVKNSYVDQFMLIRRIFLSKLGFST